MYVYVKRVLDVCMAVLALVLLSPVLLLIALAVYVSSPGPVFFKQQRMGKDLVPFTIYKFRTMRVDAPSEMPSSAMTNAGEHITAVGAVLRKFSLDELPQLINIIKGEMAFVGPRPVILGEKRLIRLRKKVNAYSVLPGLTGWAQINGRDVLNNRTKAQFDGEYVERMSFWFDLKCLVGTFTQVLRHKDVDH